VSARLPLLAAALAAPLALLGIAASPAAHAAAPAPVRAPAVFTTHAVTGPMLAHGKNDTSTNWAGYSVNSTTNHAFTSVESTFTLPKVTCTSTGDTSFWVGFDGSQASSPSVEQIGASGDCTGRTASYYAWWEMYPAGVNELTNKTKAGDVFDAKVTNNGGSAYVLTLVNKTEGWTVTKNETSSSAKDNSAEVIFEAAGPARDKVPTFSTVTMSNSTVNGTSIGSQSPEGINLVRNGDTLVTAGAIDGSGSFPFTFNAAS
jgi:hypothetical protein